MPRLTLRPLFRKRSAATNSDDTCTSTAAPSAPPSPDAPVSRKSASNAKLGEKQSRAALPGVSPQLQGIGDPAAAPGGSSPAAVLAEEKETPLVLRPQRSDSLAAKHHNHTIDPRQHTTPAAPLLVLQQPTPVAAEANPLPHDSSALPPARPESGDSLLDQQHDKPLDIEQLDFTPDSTTASQPPNRDHPAEHQYAPFASADAPIVSRTVDAPARTGYLDSASTAPLTGALPKHLTDSLPNLSAMLHRKIWVKRPNASATLVQIRQDDLVDDVREMILKKYANSLGKTFDAPDMNLNVVTRVDPHTSSRGIRVLGPEEEICTVIGELYPGGQTVDDALIIDVPQRRTPKPSPRYLHNNMGQNMDDYRPHENGTDYFPPMPAIMPPTAPHTAMPHVGREHHPSLGGSDHPRSMAVINTGQVPPLPSPGATRRHRDHRPKYGRQHTSSPVILTHPAAGTAGMNVPLLNQQQMPLRTIGRSRKDSSASEPHANGIPPAPPLPSPPAPEAPPTNKNHSTPPTPNAGGVPNAHAPRPTRSGKSRKAIPDNTSRSRAHHASNDSYDSTVVAPSISSMLDASVPPINVLIVEDNIINLRVLEGLMKRLKVRWQTAMNGQIAVDKWKLGGFHLVLMDIQMPIMNGLQATKEIRRLERVNRIGVFSSSAPTSPMEHGIDGTNGEAKEGKSDKLDMSEGLFKSPIIIVALTASSLQSDRHEALAAGCNDFLTKPVEFGWLERKVKEWGCMQALIDFDGWRKWKDYAAKEEAGKTEEQRRKEREKEEKEKARMVKMAKLQEIKQQKLKEDRERKAQRLSVDVSSSSAAMVTGSTTDASAGS